MSIKDHVCILCTFYFELSKQIVSCLKGAAIFFSKVTIEQDRPRKITVNVFPKDITPLLSQDSNQGTSGSDIDALTDKQV